ncbi:MAG: hypothetical protein QN834_11865 [Nitrososphaeraceae archaeon]|nr:hypothetical protein [Nitrososphaeraceae archaeon]
MNITDYSKAFDKTYKRVPKAEKVALTPPRTKVSTKDNPEHAIIVAYLFADKNPEQGTLFPKDITGRLLYSKETTTFPFELDRITLPTGEVKIFSRTIELEGSFEGGTFVLIYDPLGIAVSGQSIKQIEDRFHTELVSLYLASLNDDNRYSDFIKSLIPE